MMEISTILVIAVVALSSVLIWWMISQFLTTDREEAFRSLGNNIMGNLSENNHYLKTLIENQNITVNLNKNQTDTLNESGKVSGIGKPEIIQ